MNAADRAMNGTYEAYETYELAEIRVIGKKEKLARSEGERVLGANRASNRKL
jgi:hypothetical protein